MSIFEEIPEHDYTIQDRFLELLIGLEGLDVDIKENFPFITLQYGWCSYEEGESITYVLNVETLEWTEFSDGNSCEGGSWEDRNDGLFETWEQARDFVISAVKEYTEDESECSLN